MTHLKVKFIGFSLYKYKVACGRIIRVPRGPMDPGLTGNTRMVDCKQCQATNAYKRQGAAGRSGTL